MSHPVIPISYRWNVRLAACDWINETLREHAGVFYDPRNPQAFLNLAERYGVDAEGIVRWIGVHVPGKRWSIAEFTRWCIRYQQAAQELRAHQREREANLVQLCPHGHPMQQVNSVCWLCTSCGEIQ